MNKIQWKKYVKKNCWFWITRERRIEAYNMLMERIERGVKNKGE